MKYTSGSCCGPTIACEFTGSLWIPVFEKSISLQPYWVRQNHLPGWYWVKVTPQQNPRVATKHFFQGTQRIFQTDTASPVLKMSPNSTSINISWACTMCQEPSEALLEHCIPELSSPTPWGHAYSLHFSEGLQAMCRLGFHPGLLNPSLAPLLLWQEGHRNKQWACLNCSFFPFFVPPLPDDSTVLLWVDNAAELLSIIHSFIHSFNKHFKNTTYV